MTLLNAPEYDARREDRMPSAGNTHRLRSGGIRVHRANGLLLCGAAMVLSGVFRGTTTGCICAIGG